ncbi:hypothetical protein GCM10023189_40410 [Nibrella saemangeumensis]|uniref:Uncharacterized protein n=1 Tax=Nibrella saemangeumensis TaxID=1084526 RepID=A0ABP8NB95_9BACT
MAIITIDTTKELTRKEYIDFVQKTKGESISESRISQLVTANKLKVRDYPELNNLQLIVLDDDEQALAQGRFTTTQAIHTYSYKELGLMFGKLIQDLNNEVGNAKTLQTEKQEQIDHLASQLLEVEASRDEAHQQINQLIESVNQAANEKQQWLVKEKDLDAQLELSRAENVQLKERLTALQQKLDAESGFRAEFEDFKQLMMNLLQENKPAKKRKAQP